MPPKPAHSELPIPFAILLTDMPDSQLQVLDLIFSTNTLGQESSKDITSLDILKYFKYLMATTC